MTCSPPWMARSTRSSTSSPAPSACGHDANSRVAGSTRPTAAALTSSPRQSGCVGTIAWTLTGGSLTMKFVNRMRVPGQGEREYDDMERVNIDGTYKQQGP